MILKYMVSVSRINGLLAANGIQILKVGIQQDNKLLKD